MQILTNLKIKIKIMKLNKNKINNLKIKMNQPMKMILINFIQK